MSYLSPTYYILVLVLAILYYIIPKRQRWYILFIGSMYFYYALTGSIKTFSVFVAEIFVVYAAGILIERKRQEKYGKILAGIMLILCLLPLLCIRFQAGLFTRYSFLVTVGVSYYTLQMISYIADIYTEKISAQKNPLKFALYMSFFPQIVQGPIPRYGELSGQLFNGNDFKSENIFRGTELIIWGFFLKYMIADRALPAVDQIFAGFEDLPGAVIALGGILYSLQIYADFLACVTISQGVASLFGIRLSDNFRRPYFAPSIREFWRRWHMSLSYWLRDYVYIPLGGGKKGKIRRYINLCITFIISGFWHGRGLNFLAWGLLHAMYQIIGGFTWNLRNRFWEIIRVKSTSVPVRMIRALGTSFLAMNAWILFRAESLSKGMHMIRLMYEKFEFQQIRDMGLVIKMGAFIGPKEWYMLIISGLFLLAADLIRSRTDIIKKLNEKPVIVRGIVITAVFMLVFIFGSYGYGFEASDFIYGGF